MTAKEEAEAVFDRLCRTTYRRLLAKAVLVTGGQVASAQDAVQESFVKCWQRMTSTGQEPVANWNAWLARVVVHDALAQIGPARTAVVEGWEGLDAAALGPDHATSFVLKEAFRTVCKEVRYLPPQRRRCLVFHCLGGFSIREIAGQLGLTESAVRSHITLARRDLRPVWVDLVRMEVLEDGEWRES
ncbi:hypothetical protein GCM10009665_01600 [Kitasatospora nipponensis]|uniref:RNA polymerase sigma factor 70 region 4 type 2 domain-containing protein n=1 Tax=Kitasatospora nipponensis TaxID=258049 RepID=A0ABN1VLU3_9ACTN